MGDVLTWGALFAAIGALLGIIGFWVQRGIAEGKMQAQIEGLQDDVDSARSAATLAGAEAKMVGSQLAEARLEIAKNFATQAGLLAVESRFADALEGLRREMSKITDRLDRILEGRREN